MGDNTETIHVQNKLYWNDVYPVLISNGENLQSCGIFNMGEQIYYNWIKSCINKIAVMRYGLETRLIDKSIL